MNSILNIRAKVKMKKARPRMKHGVGVVIGGRFSNVLGVSKMVGSKD
jgi:hypothetical protein